MASHDVREWLTLIIAAGALPAVIVAGLFLRHARSGRGRTFGWLLWFVWSLGLWLICLPGTQRTNEPTGEGIVIRFLLTYGPALGAVWLAVQHLLGGRTRAARGFEVVELHQSR